MTKTPLTGIALLLLLLITFSQSSAAPITSYDTDSTEKLGRFTGQFDYAFIGANTVAIR